MLSSISINRLILKELDWLERYRYHYDHTLVTTALVAAMGLDFYENEMTVSLAASATLTNEFGMTRVPEGIFLKQGRLEKEEQNALQEHPIYSYLLLTYYGYGNPDINANVGFEQHEDMLGTGYPRGVVLQNDISQLVQVSDMFDALITTRPFRPAMRIEEALQILLAGVREGKLNSEIVSLFSSRIRTKELLKSSC